MSQSTRQQRRSGEVRTGGSLRGCPGSLGGVLEEGLAVHERSGAPGISRSQQAEPWFDCRVEMPGMLSGLSPSEAGVPFFSFLSYRDEPQPTVRTEAPCTGQPGSGLVLWSLGCPSCQAQQEMDFRVT